MAVWLGGGATLGLLLSIARAPTVAVLRFAALLWPFVAAVRLYRNNEKRRALTLAFAAVARRFCSRWWQYATIPLFAGAVGWFTNKVAVEMIFRPLGFWGVPIRRYPNNPLGWIGWQGIVPAKAGVMAKRLTEIVTTKLIDVMLWECHLKWRGQQGKCQCAAWEEQLRTIGGVRKVYHEPYPFAGLEKGRGPAWVPPAAAMTTSG